MIVAIFLYAFQIHAASLEARKLTLSYLGVKNVFEFEA